MLRLVCLIWLCTVTANAQLIVSDTILRGEQVVLPEPVGVDDGFGESLAYLGDVDGDGVGDLAIGMPWTSHDSDPNDVPPLVGQVLIALMDADGTMREAIPILPGPDDLSLETYTPFGNDLAPLGDLDQDGIPDLACLGQALWILLLQADGSVKQTIRHDPDVLGGVSTYYSGLVALGDEDGDGRTELAFGAGRQVRLTSLNPDGTLAWVERLQQRAPGQLTINLACMGDLDGNGHSELVRSYFPSRSVEVLFRDSPTSVSHRVAVPNSSNASGFGIELTTMPDVNADGRPELVIGAPFVNSVLVVGLDSEATVTRFQRYNFRRAVPAQRYGAGLAVLPDADNDGVADLAVGGGGNFGRVRLLRLSCGTDSDRLFGIGELTEVLTNFGETGFDGPADINRDRHVDLSDLAVVLQHWGQGCH